MKRKGFEKTDPEPPTVVDLCSRELFSSSSLIPFYQTAASLELCDWIDNWSQSCPACLLFGPIASGKTRLVEYIATRFCAHIIETDCASISGVKELLQISKESTQSHSVGVFSDATKTKFTSISSIVVFEHFDHLQDDHGSLTPAFLNLLSNSRVPIIMTSNREIAMKGSSVRAIRVERPMQAFNILMSTLWMKGRSRTIVAQQEIQSLLSFSDNDMRKTALQFQVFPKGEQMIDRRENIWLSIPKVVDEKSAHLEWYSLLCDTVAVSDCDDLFLDRYMRPCGERIFTEQREQLGNEYYEKTHSKLKFISDGDDRELMISFLCESCKNCVSITRRHCVPPFSGKNRFSDADREEVLNWKWWTRISSL